MPTAVETLNDRQTSQDQAEILALIESTHRAHHYKNAEVFAAPFAPDALIFNLAPPLAHHGIDLDEKRAWFATWDGPIEITSRDLKVTVSGDSAFCHGYLHLSGNKKGVGEVSFWMRETLCLGREQGSWQIVHEHTSVPFYMNGAPLGAFDLEP